MRSVAAHLTILGHVLVGCTTHILVLEAAAVPPRDSISNAALHDRVEEPLAGDRPAVQSVEGLQIGPALAGDASRDDDKSDEQLAQLWRAYFLITRAQELDNHVDLVYSRDLINRAADIVAQTSGIDSPDYAICMAALGSINGQLYKLDAAVSELEKASELMQRFPGFSFKNRIAVDCNLALAQRRRGNFDISEGLYKQVLRQFHRDSKTADADYAIVLVSLANVYLDAQDSEKAHAYLLDADKALAAKDGSDDPYLCARNTAWARYHYMTQNYADSDKLFHDTLAMFNRSKSPRLVNYAEVVCYFSESLIKRSKYADALVILSNRTDEIEKCLGRDHPRVREIKEKSAKLEGLIAKDQSGDDSNNREAAQKE